MKNISSIHDERIKQILTCLNDNLSNLFGNSLKDIILYGSYARNEHTIESDMDILILVDVSEETLKTYEDSLENIMVDLSIEYDIVLSLYAQCFMDYSQQVSILPFFNNIQQEGIRIHG